MNSREGNSSHSKKRGLRLDRFVSAIVAAARSCRRTSRSSGGDATQHSSCQMLSHRSERCAQMSSVQQRSQIWSQREKQIPSLRPRKNSEKKRAGAVCKVPFARKRSALKSHRPCSPWLLRRRALKSHRPRSPWLLSATGFGRPGCSEAALPKSHRPRSRWLLGPLWFQSAAGLWAKQGRACTRSAVIMRQCPRSPWSRPQDTANNRAH